MRNLRILFLGSLCILTLLSIFGCSLSGGHLARNEVTPTKTLLPLYTATLTPTALPTDTPAPTPTPPPPTPTPPPITQTPMLVTATPSPAATSAPPAGTAQPSEGVSPTATPEPTTEAPPAATLEPQATATPVAPPPPQATNTPAPPTSAPEPDVDFRIAEIVAFEDGSLGSTGGHYVNITVGDADGLPLDGIIIEETNNSPRSQMTSGDKGPGKAEFTMWAADYRFKIVGSIDGDTYTSEETHVLSILQGHAQWDDLIRGGICETPEACDAIGSMHYSYNLTFQRTW